MKQYSESKFEVHVATVNTFDTEDDLDRLIVLKKSMQYPMN